MTTIRRRLTWRLLAGWASLLVVAGLITYVITRAALTRQFDDALRAKAMAITTLTEEDKGRVELDFTSQFMREFDAEVSTAFFQLWQANGGVVERSKSLRGASLPLRYGTLHTPEFWDLDLPGGLAGRAVGLKFQLPKSSAKKQAALEAILVVAGDRRNLDKTLATLRLVLSGCGGLLLLLTAATVPWLLRRELAPLNRLADQTQRIAAESLSARFPTAELPGELLPISTRLNDLLQRLETAFARERQFSEDLAHEFRTPIAELRSQVELALKWPEARDAQTDRNLLAIALQMESIVTRLLAIAHSEKGQVPVMTERVDAAALVPAICQQLQAKAASRQLALEVKVPPLELQSDQVLLRSIMTNLIDNAVEYAPPRSTVRIQADSQTGRFTLSVANPVEHLDMADLPRFFDRFWRKDPARSSAEHAGLGLSLARALAVSLGYTLNAALNGEGCLLMTLSGPVTLEQPGQPSAAREKSTQIDQK